MTVLYGIPNCDTCRKACRWLEANAVDYRFHDLRADGLDEHRIAAWLEQFDAAALVNRRSTTWRQLDATKRALANGPEVMGLLAAHPKLVKRPVLETDDTTCLVGFREEIWRGALLGGRDAS